MPAFHFSDLIFKTPQIKHISSLSLSFSLSLSSISVRFQNALYNHCSPIMPARPVLNEILILGVSKHFDNELECYELATRLLHEGKSFITRPRSDPPHVEYSVRRVQTLAKAARSCSNWPSIDRRLDSRRKNRHSGIGSKPAGSARLVKLSRFSIVAVINGNSPYRYSLACQKIMINLISLLNLLPILTLFHKSRQ